MNIKPLLASLVTDFDALPLPMMASPKFDGFRLLTVPSAFEHKKCHAVSRNLKPIANNFIRNWIEAHVEPGFDGEAMIFDKAGKPLPFNEVSSVLTRAQHELEEQFVYCVFDFVGKGLDGPFGVCRKAPFEKRYAELASEVHDIDCGTHVKFVFHMMIHTMDELDEYEAEMLEKGFEGIMLRRPNGIYKMGRSTEKEAILLKVKRFAQDEAWVVGKYEEMENTNEKQTDALGHAKRSSHKAGMKGKGTLGGIVIKPMKFGKPTIDEVMGVQKAIIEDRLDAYLSKSKTLFKCGSGFTAAHRTAYWLSDLDWNQMVATYKHQESGAKEGGKPRFPTWIGFRSIDDL